MALKKRKKLLKTRKRLAHPNTMKALNAGRDKAIKEAPRLENGKIVPGHAYKKLIDAHKRYDIKPKKLLNHYASKPLFMREPKLGNKIIRFLRLGYHYTTVCRAVGIESGTLRRWMSLGLANASPEYAKYFSRICKAEAQAEMSDLKKLSEHQKYDWRASAWKLERRWPEHWARRDAEKASLKVAGQITVTHKHELSKKVAEDPVALELARKMIDGNEFGYDEVGKDDNTNTTETT